MSFGRQDLCVKLDGASNGIRTHGVLLGKQDLSFLATSFATTRSASSSSVSGDREASTPFC